MSSKLNHSFSGLNSSLTALQTPRISKSSFRNGIPPPSERRNSVRKPFVKPSSTFPSSSSSSSTVNHGTPMETPSRPKRNVTAMQSSQQQYHGPTTSNSFFPSSSSSSSGRCDQEIGQYFADCKLRESKLSSQIEKLKEENCKMKDEKTSFIKEKNDEILSLKKQLADLERELDVRNGEFNHEKQELTMKVNEMKSSNESIQEYYKKEIFKLQHRITAMSQPLEHMGIDSHSLQSLESSHLHIKEEKERHIRDCDQRMSRLQDILSQRKQMYQNSIQQLDSLFSEIDHIPFQFSLDAEKSSL